MKTGGRLTLCESLGDDPNVPIRYVLVWLWPYTLVHAPLLLLCLAVLCAQFAVFQLVGFGVPQTSPPAKCSSCHRVVAAAHSSTYVARPCCISMYDVFGMTRRKKKKTSLQWYGWKRFS